MLVPEFFLVVTYNNIKIRSCLGRGNSSFPIVPDLFWWGIGQSSELSREDSVPLLCLGVLEQQGTRSFEFSIGLAHHLEFPLQGVGLLLLALLTDQLPGSLDGLVAGHILGGHANGGARGGVKEDLLDEVVTGVTVEGGASLLHAGRATAGTHQCTAGGDGGCADEWTGHCDGG